jgi:hypothetical protein
MARPKKFSHTLALNLRQIDRAILTYYADRYTQDQARIARTMIREYAHADVNFDTKAFKRFVDSKVIAELEDTEQQEDLKQQLKVFLGKHRGK